MCPLWRWCNGGLKNLSNLLKDEELWQSLNWGGFESRSCALNMLRVYSVKLCFCTPVFIAAEKLNMAVFSPGGLFRSFFGKSKEPWIPCQLYHGMCRNTCRKHEIQYLTCPNDQKCCLKFSEKITSSNNVKESSDSNANMSVTNT